MTIIMARHNFKASRKGKMKMSYTTLYRIYERRWFSWEGFVYYMKHRKALTKETLARALTTRDDKGFSSSSIFSTITSTLNDVYTVKRDGEDLKEVTPLTKLQPGDIIWCLSFMSRRYWEYDGERINFVRDS